MGYEPRQCGKAGPVACAGGKKEGKVFLLRADIDALSTPEESGEDFAYVSHAVPSLMLSLAAGQPEKGYLYPQHHPMVRFDEAALTNGCAVYAYAAMRWLEDAAQRKS